MSQTAEKEFLRFKKVTADGRPITADPADLFDLLQLDQRADRILPNGWCMLPPKQTCSRGNACLTCDKFATDASHQPELSAQLTATQQLVQHRQTAFRARFGAEMSEDNVWLQGRASRDHLPAAHLVGHRGDPARSGGPRRRCS